MPAKKSTGTTGTTAAKPAVVKDNNTTTGPDIAKSMEKAFGSSVTDAKVSAKTTTAKTMGTTDQNRCREVVPDVVIFGEDLFKLLSKASSENEGWMKSTKAMDTGKGCVVQVTTQQRNRDGSYAVAEAITFIPGVKILEKRDENNIVIGRSLIGKS